MNCRKVKFYLSAFSEGSLSPELSDALETHIRNCKSCEREKSIAEQILAAAKTLPTKKLADDFNLRLLNRAYAEQHNPTESYLPVEQPSWLTRPVGLVTALATIALAAVVAVSLLRSEREPVDIPSVTPSYTQADEASSAAAVNAGQRELVHFYDNLIGVSGAHSNYRATNVSQVKTLHLADAKVESLFVELQKRLGNLALPTGSYGRFADNRYYGNPSSLMNRRSNQVSPMLRNASATY